MSPRVSPARFREPIWVSPGLPLEVRPTAQDGGWGLQVLRAARESEGERRGARRPAPVSAISARSRGAGLWVGRALTGAAGGGSASLEGELRAERVVP